MSFLSTLVTAFLVFVATSIDDIVLLTVYFGSLSASLRPRHIVAGQYVGFAVLIAFSLLGSLGALVVPEEDPGFLGVLPILLGLLALRRGDGEGALARVVNAVDQPGRSVPAPQTLAVAGVTVANSSDNLSIDIPLFANTPPAQVPLVARTVSRYEDVLVPFVLTGLGVFILYESGALGVLLGWFGGSA